MDEKSILLGFVSRLGQAGAASLIGVSQPTVSRWLAGKNGISPGMKKLIRMAVSDDQGKVLEPEI